MPRIPFRLLLAGASGLLVVVTTLAILAVSLTANRRTTYELLSNQAVLAIDAVEQGVRQQLAPAANLLAGLAEPGSAALLARQDREEIVPLFTSLLAAVPSVDALIMWNPQLQPMAVARTPGGGIQPLVLGASTDPRLRPRFDALPADGTPAWGGPTVQRGVPLLDVARRLTVGEWHGYVAVVTALSNFSTDLARVGRKFGGTAFILIGEHQVLAHPALAGQPAARGGIPTVGQVGDPAIARLATATPAVFFGDDAPADVRALRVDTADGARLVVMRDLAGLGPKPWRLGVHFGGEEVQESIRRLVVSGLVGLVIAVLGVGGAFAFGRIVSRPVTRLAKTAEAVARLDFDDVDLPAASPIREIDDQASAFRLMLSGLQVFAIYVPRTLVRRILEQGQGGAMPSETRDLTVMFTDIKGFSQISARMGAEDTASFLNRHFAILGGCIAETGGTIDKFIGDAVMAFWGAPEPMEDHAARAVEAARRVARALDADNARRARKGLKPVGIRIGLHSGPVIVGNIGAPDRVNYTIVGPDVNISQRLEELGHRVDGGDTTILMSAATAAAAGLGAEEVESLGACALRGLPVEIEVVRLKV